MKLNLIKSTLKSFSPLNVIIIDKLKTISTYYEQDNYLYYLYFSVVGVADKTMVAHIFLTTVCNVLLIYTNISTTNSTQYNKYLLYT